MMSGLNEKHVHFKLYDMFIFRSENTIEKTEGAI